jgi:hypothetical protein
MAGEEKTAIGTALTLVDLFNTLAPGVANLIILFRRKDGAGVTVVSLLDEADAQFDANMKQASDWLKSHPKPNV